jgi:O-antigen ligase
VPAAVRRLADALLALTAISLPLSITGMQIGIVGLVVLAGVAWLAGWQVVERTPLDEVLALFFVVLLISTLVSGAPLEAEGWRRPWVVIGYFGVFWWLRDRADARRFALLTVAAGGLVAAYGIVQHYTGIDLYRSALGRPRRVRPRVDGVEGYAVVGFFRNYVTFAHAMLVPLGWAVAFALRGWRSAGLAAGLLVIAILFSTARAVWTAIAAMAVLVPLLGWRRHAWRAVAGGVVVAGLAIAASPGLREQAAPIFTLDAANTARLAIYRANLDIVRDHPVFGLGFGRYKTAAQPYYDRHPEADRRSHAHSNFLQMAAEAGLVGLLAFTLLLATALRFGWQAMMQSMAVAPDGDAWATAAGAWLALVGLIVAGINQYNFGDNECAVGLWAATAVLMRCRQSP